MITKELAMKIWRCYQEIETAQKLHEECKQSVDKAKPDHWRDAFGRERGLQLGVPSGQDSQRIYEVSPTAALLVLADHIQSMNKQMKSLQIEAKQALSFYSEHS